MSEINSPPSLGARIAAEWGHRPWWMNLLFGFCIYQTFIYTPFDLFIKPVAEDAEVWFGLMLHGWAAKATTPLHWAIYGAGAYGFWKMRPWMWPWASLYVAQVAIGTVIWSVLYAAESRIGIVGGTIAGALVVVPAVALWRSRERFQGSA